MNIQQITDLLKDGNVLERLMAVRAAAQTQEQELVSLLLSHLQKEKSPGVRRAVAEALGKLGDPRAVPALIEVLKHDNKKVRRAAAEALGIIGSREAVPALIQALGINRGWRDAGVPEAAAEALGKLGAPEAVPALVEALREETLSIQIAAAKALGAIAAPEAVRPLIEAYWESGRLLRETYRLSLKSIFLRLLLPLGKETAKAVEDIFFGF